MGKPVVLPTTMYQLIAGLAKGEQVTLVLHGAPKDRSKCEVVSRGQKPIKCSAKRTHRKGKSGGSAKIIEIVFTRL